MAELNNKYAYDDFNFAFYNGAAGFYIITAAPYMHRRIADNFTAENPAVYDYSGKENANTFSPKELFHFIEDNNEKDVFFILNFQIPFFGKSAKTAQPDYFALNLCRDVLASYNKKIFFFATEQTEHNISIAAMDFFDYFFPKIVFVDEKKNETDQQIIKLDEEKDKIYYSDEIEERLDRYSDKIEEYCCIEEETIFNPPDKKTENYLLVAARDLDNFAGLYKKTGKYGKALELYEKALQIREKILGVEHARTADTYDNIGGVYDDMGNYNLALEYFDKAKAIREKILGAEHPDTASTYNNMANVYYVQGDYESALEYYYKSLAIFEKVLGLEHPDTATTYNNMASVYNAQGDYERALEYHEKAKAIREKVLGVEHPDTATTYNNMANVYDAQGDYDRALEYYGKALAIREKVFGKEHPKTKTTHKNMTITLGKK